jgi:serine/threonine-protein kinase
VPDHAEQLDRLKTALADRYRIERELGAGGMATVYLAQDVKLDRQVAVKVLRPELAAVLGAERFVQEIKTTAKLHHPNILPLFDSGEAGGFLYYVMPFVTGETVREKLDRETQLAIEEAVRITTEMAAALDYAHRHNVIHRDIKPENILLHDGRAMVADFGIAVAVSEAGGTRLTETGFSLGTPAYMSPEQASGDRSLDGRSDCYALACVLYEMLAGDPPFVASTAQAVIAKHVTDVAPSVATVRPDTSGNVTAALAKALSKAPADRFDSIVDFAVALAAPAADRQETQAPSAHEVPWIAVLPFRTRSSDPALESFGDDLAEDIATGMSRYPLYHVVAASSTLRFKGRTMDVRDVARELGARYVLEGSVREAGKNLRVSAQLSDAITGTELWAETFDRNLDTQDLFALQDDLTDHIVAPVADVHGVLARSMGALVKSKPVETLSAYESVLQWLAYFEQITPAEHSRAREALERAVNVEPNYACAWACLSSVYLDEYRFDFNTRDDPLDRALHAARKAVVLDATSALSASCLAMAYFHRGDLVAFRSTAERAMALNPRDASTLALLGIQIAHVGDWETGVPITQRAMSLNPHHPGWYYFGMFDDHYRKHEYDQALATAKKINMPGHSYYHAAIAASAGQLGRKEDARAAVDELLEVVPDFGERARKVYATFNNSEEFIEHMFEGFRKAGLEISC